MRRNRRRYITDVFYTTGDMNPKSVEESVNISKNYADSLQEPMLEEERLRLKKEEEERNRLNRTPGPNTDLNNTPGKGPQ